MMVTLWCDKRYDAKGNLMAMVLRGNRTDPGIMFLTQPEESCQVGVMFYPPGKVIPPHRHEPQERVVKGTWEVLFLRSGTLRVTLYDVDETQSLPLFSGEVILLLSGGHSFEALTDVELVEIKQGPYSQEKDKVSINA